MTVWQRPTRCDAGQCVEVAEVDAEWRVRDGKNPNGPVLVFDRGEWAALVAGVKAAVETILVARGNRQLVPAPSGCALKGNGNHDRVAASGAAAQGGTTKRVLTKARWKGNGADQ